MNFFAYFFYIITWEVMVWAGTVYLIVGHGWSKWFLLLAFLLSVMAYKPPYYKDKEL